MPKPPILQTTSLRLGSPGIGRVPIWQSTMNKASGIPTLAKPVPSNGRRCAQDETKRQLDQGETEGIVGGLIKTQNAIWDLAYQLPKKQHLDENP